MNLSAKGCKKRLNSWKSTKNYRFGKNFATFRTKYHVFAFPSTFQEKVAKSASFREKTRETIDFAKTCKFWSKLPCLGIFMNFSERSLKKCFISWKSTRNHWFGQHYASFRTKYHVFAFRWTFKEKVGKSCSFREKARKIVELDKLAFFRTKYHVFTFRWTFRQTVAKTAWFREKARKLIDLAKTCIFSSKLRCLGIFMNFSERNCKRCLIWWKSTGNHRFCQNLQLFEKTTMLSRFDELYGKKLQKLPHIVEKHEDSSIWPKLWNFFEQTTMFWCLDKLFSKRLQKVAQFVKKHEESSIWPKLCNFSRKLPWVCISMNFWGKSCKKCLIS